MIVAPQSLPTISRQYARTMSTMSPCESRLFNVSPVLSLAAPLAEGASPDPVPTLCVRTGRKLQKLQLTRRER